MKKKNKRAMVAYYSGILFNTFRNIDMAHFIPLDNKLQKLVVGIEPIQDLHGYDAPWPGGGGKNKLEPVMLSILKSVNSGWTWDNNVATVNGLTITVVIDGNGNPTGEYELSGTSSAVSNFYVLRGEASTYAGMKLNGAPASGAGKWELIFALQASPYTGWAYDNGSGATINASASGMSILFFQVKSGKNIDGLVLRPMIYSASETDATFSPYSNICPISGHTDADVIVSPTLNQSDGTTYPIPLGTTVYGGQLDVLTGVLTVDRAMDTLNGTQTLYFNGQTSARTEFYFVPSSTKKPAAQAATQNEGIVSDIFKSQPYVDGPYAVTGRTANGNIYFTLPPEVNSIALADAWLSSNNANIVYELATPQTIQLTPQQINTIVGSWNYVWCDTGKIIEIEG